MRPETAATLIVCIFASTIVTAAESRDFNEDVLPVFRKYCQACHNAKEAEGGLVLQDFARTMKGGDDGNVIVAGKSDQSRLWKRVVAQDETRMPPKDQPAPGPAELAIIKSWIDGGAKAPAGGLSATGLVTPKIASKFTVRQPMTSVATSPDGRWIALARPRSIEVIGEDAVKTLNGHLGTINEVSFSRDGRWLCVAAGETGLVGEATLWNTADWSKGPRFQGHRDAVYSAQVSPSGTILATASYDREMITWNIETAQPIKVFQGHNDAIYSLCFSPKGNLLATASGDRTVKLWDVASGQRLDTFSQPAKDQTTVAFSPDGQFIVSGGVDNRIRVWNVSESGREGTNPILYARFAHEGPILKLAFSPNGRLLASSSEDRRIKIWETKTFTQVAVIERQVDWTTALAFTENNRQLLVGRMNGDYQFYPIDPKWADMKSALAPLEEVVNSMNAMAPLEPEVIVESEPNDQPSNAMFLATPCSVKGELKTSRPNSTDVDLFRFNAKSGEQLMIETNAARSGSLADTRIEILHADGRPVLRGLLQAVRDSWINFRPIDSSSPDVRLEYWEEMDLNQFVYMSGEVCKTFRAPQGPDSGFQLYMVNGKRKDYFDTSAAGHAKDEPAYIVEAFSPDSKIVENGLPVFPLYFANDDDGDRKWDKDSHVTFTAPTDGTYLVKVTDVRGFSGEKYFYTLTVRRPRPGFSATINTMNPKIPAGSGQRLKFTLDRHDNFDGEVRLDIAGLPKGFEASSPVTVQSGLLETFSVLSAASDAPEPTKSDWDRVTVLATAEINGHLVTKTVGGLGELKLEKAPQIRVALVPDDPQHTSEDNGLIIAPGTTITARIKIERHGHDDDVRFEVDNLPHGIIVDNIGLSGVLVRKGETERQIFLTARPWVPETTSQIHAVAQSVGNQVSPSIRLRVRRHKSAVQNLQSSNTRQ